MELINKKDDQSIFDVLLENGGALSGLFDFLHANNLTSIDIPSGTYIAPEVMKQEVVDFYSKLNSNTNFSLASSDVSLPAYTILIQAINTLNEVIASGNYAPGTGVQQLEIPDGHIQATNSDGDVISTDIYIPGTTAHIEIPNINFIDSNGISSSVPAGTDIIAQPCGVPAHWTRNPDWLPLGTVAAGSNRFSGLFAVYETQKNVCTIQCETGTRTIDWGDGTTQVASSGLLYTKVYDYATITSPIITDEFGYNYKTVVVNISMTSCTQLYIDRNTTATVINNSRSLNWLDIALDCSTLIIFSPSGQAIANKLERLLIYNVGSFISGAPSFIQMASLKVLKFPFEKLQSSNQTFINYLGDVRNEDGTPIDMNFSINTGSLFNLLSLSSITRLGNFSASLSTSGQALFENSTQLRSIGNINLSSVTNLVSMFASCVNLEDVVNITITSTCNSITNIGINARKCRGFIIGNCSGVTSATNAFFNMVSMKTLILTGMTRGFVIDDCNMSATAIDALFSSLGTASGSQTISVKRNPGSLTCNTSIATTKGFTVLTS